MKNILFLLVSVLLVSSCTQKQKNQNKDHEPLKTILSDFDKLAYSKPDSMAVLIEENLLPDTQLQTQDDYLLQADAFQKLGICYSVIWDLSKSDSCYYKATEYADKRDSILQFKIYNGYW